MRSRVARAMPIDDVVNGTPVAGWFNYQPLWDRIVKEQPELLN